MDKKTIDRVKKLEEVIYGLIEELAIKTKALESIYNENVRRLREQNQLEGMDKG